MNKFIWKPIASAPKDDTPIDLWVAFEPTNDRGNGVRLVNYKRIQLSHDNVFYEPVRSGRTCVRTATHWMVIPEGPNYE